MPLQQKRRLNHALFSGIVSFIKRGEDKGEIEIKIRGDGSLKRTWEDLKKENQVRQVRTPGSLGSARATDVRTSLVLKIPLIFMNVHRGEKRLWIEFDRFRTRFHLSEGCAERFRKALCMPSRPMIGISRPTTTETGRVFAALLASGGCQSKTEIAKRFGVSRAWVSKSMMIAKKR